MTLFSSSDHDSAHFHDRMLERYNFYPTPEVVSQMSKMIDEAHEDCDIIEMWDFPRCRFRVRYCFSDYIVVYNVIEKVLITVLPISDPKPVEEKEVKFNKVGKMKKMRKKHEEYTKQSKHKAKMFVICDDETDD